MVQIICVKCGNTAEAQRRTRKYCDNCGYDTRTEPLKKPCRRCKRIFEVAPRVEKMGTRYKFCSDECARATAVENRLASAKRAAHGLQNPNTGRPRTLSDEERKRRKQIGVTGRFFLRHPERAAVCEACGESRIVELAHKVPRQGRWRTLGNTRNEDVWILCPTCHRLLDRGMETIESLGLKP